MPKRLPLLLLVVVGALVSTALASAGESSDRVIRLFSKTTNFDVSTDKPPLGTLSKGDVFRSDSLLRNAVVQFGKHKGAAVGRDTARGVLESNTLATLSVKATLPGGTISCRGKSHKGVATTTLRIVGGTGVFARATGTCEETPPPKNPYRADAFDTYTLRIP